MPHTPCLSHYLSDAPSTCTVSTNGPDKVRDSGRWEVLVGGGICHQKNQAKELQTHSRKTDLKSRGQSLHVKQLLDGAAKVLLLFTRHRRRCPILHSYNSSHAHDMAWPGMHQRQREKGQRPLTCKQCPEKLLIWNPPDAIGRAPAAMISSSAASRCSRAQPPVWLGRHKRGSAPAWRASVQALWPVPRPSQSRPA